MPAADGGTDDLSFRNYTERVIRASGAAAVVRVVHARYITDLAGVGLTVGAITLLALALRSWDHYGRSSRLLLVAWLLAFAAPFGVSAIPTRALIDWDRFDGQSAAFVHGSRLDFTLPCPVSANHVVQNK